MAARLWGGQVMELLSTSTKLRNDGKSHRGGGLPGPVRIGWRPVCVRKLAHRQTDPTEASEPGEVGNLRVRRADDRQQLRAVRPAVLRRGAALHHLRRGGCILLPVGDCVRQGYPSNGCTFSRRRGCGGGGGAGL